MSRKRRGFTLIELLVVIAIIAVLIACCCPPCRRPARPPAAPSASTTSSNWRLASHNYESANKCLQALTLYGNPPTRCQPWYGFGPFIPILPYMEQSNIFNVFNMTAPSTGPRTTALPGSESRPRCPSDPLVADGESIFLPAYTVGGNPPPDNPRQGSTSYAGNAGMWGIWQSPCSADFAREQAMATGTMYAHSCTRLAGITDGTSNTMLYSDRPFGLIARNGGPTPALASGGIRATGAIRTSRPSSSPTACGRTRPSSTRAGGRSPITPPEAIILAV